MEGSVQKCKEAEEQVAMIELEGANCKRKCEVHLLNGQEFQCNVEKNATGTQLLQQVRELLDIVDFDYFGLYFEGANQVKCWLKGEISVKKQLKLKGSPWKFHLSVKFYPSDPLQLVEDVSRYYMVLQLRDEIVSGRLSCSSETHALLGSFVVQSELGDYDAASMKGNYVKGFQFAPNQTRALEENVIEQHKARKGLTPETAESAFLENVKKLSMYGVDQYVVKDVENVGLVLGVCWDGLRVYRNKEQINRFPWPQIMKMSYARCKFLVETRPIEDQEEQGVHGFRLRNHRTAKMLWKSCAEHHTFFRVKTPSVARFKFIGAGSSFKFTGQTQRQLSQNTAPTKSNNFPKIQRTNSRMSYTGRPSKMSSSSSQSPPELPRKESHSTTAIITGEVVTQDNEKDNQNGDSGAGFAGVDEDP